MDDTGTRGPERGRLAAAISNAILGIHRQYYGRGASRARTVMGAEEPGVAETESTSASTRRAYRLGACRPAGLSAAARIGFVENRHATIDRRRISSWHLASRGEQGCRAIQD